MTLAVPKPSACSAHHRSTHFWCFWCAGGFRLTSGASLQWRRRAGSGGGITGAAGGGPTTAARSLGSMRPFFAHRIPLHNAEFYRSVFPSPGLVLSISELAFTVSQGFRDDVRGKPLRCLKGSLRRA